WARFSTPPSLTWFEKKRLGLGASYKDAVIFSERSRRRAAGCVIIVLLLPPGCLSASQVHQNDPASSGSHAAILKDNDRAFGTTGPIEENSKELPELVIQSGHAGSITAMAFFDDDFLATASIDGTAKVWHASTGQLLRTLKV